MHSVYSRLDFREFFRKNSNVRHTLVHTPHALSHWPSTSIPTHTHPSVCLSVSLTHTHSLTHSLTHTQSVSELKATLEVLQKEFDAVKGRDIKGVFLSRARARALSLSLARSLALLCLSVLYKYAGTGLSDPMSVYTCMSVYVCEVCLCLSAACQRM